MFWRALALVTLFACARDELASGNPPPKWVYEPPPPSWQHGELRGRFGRSQPLQRPRAGGVIGDVRVPLRRPRVWAVPGVGPVRAIVDGFEGVKRAVELIDVEGGRALWRETATCTAPVVGVTSETVVCGDANGTRAIGLDGKPKWQTEAAFVAMTGERIVVTEGDNAITLVAATGEREATVKLPAPIVIAAIVAACEDELYAFGKDSRLVQITKGKAKWSTLVGGAFAAIDPCGESILLAAGLLSTRSAGPGAACIPGPGCTDRGTLFSIERSNGRVTGKVNDVRGFWPARDDSARIEVATRAGVTSWPRELAGDPIALELPPLGALIDRLGDRRLVRVSEHTVVLLDRQGVHSYLPLTGDGAVLGGNAIVAATSNAGPGETVRRIAIPERTRRFTRVPSRGVGVAVPAELRDLPAPVELDASTAIAKPDTGKHGIATFAIDPLEPATLYAVALEREPTEEAAAVLASVDLATKTWRWQRAEGCGTGIAVALALADGIVVCAARGITATIRATSRDGAARWDHEADHVDTISGGGDTILVHDAARLTVLDAATGRVRGRLASDDGAAVRAAVVPIAGTTWLVIYEAGRIVVRIPALGMLAVWSLAVDGHVRAIAPSGTGVFVELEDGDAYRVEVPTAAVTPLPGLDLTWRANGELVTGHATGGPIPGIPLPRVYVPPKLPIVPRKPFDPNDRNPDPPILWTPIKPPPPLGDSWQYTLYELTGGLRARNDYAIAAPIMPAAVRGPTGSPLVVAYGPGLREVLVLDPRTGDPIKRVKLPEGASPGHVFGTIVEGTPVAGALLVAPLRAVVF